MKLNFTVDTTNAQEVNEALTILSSLTTVASKTDAKAKTTPETTPESPETEKPVKRAPRKLKAETKTEPEPDNEAPVTPTATMNDIKLAARAAIAASDKDAVKKTISRYGQKLAEVTENNYDALLADLKGMVA